MNDNIDTMLKTPGLVFYKGQPVLKFTPNSLIGKLANGRSFSFGIMFLIGQNTEIDVRYQNRLL